MWQFNFGVEYHVFPGAQLTYYLQVFLKFYKQDIED